MSDFFSGLGGGEESLDINNQTGGFGMHGFGMLPSMSDDERMNALPSPMDFMGTGLSQAVPAPGCTQTSFGVSQFPPPQAQLGFQFEKPEPREEDDVSSQKTRFSDKRRGNSSQKKSATSSSLGPEKYDPPSLTEKWNVEDYQEPQPLAKRESPAKNSFYGSGNMYPEEPEPPRPKKMKPRTPGKGFETQGEDSLEKQRLEEKRIELEMSRISERKEEEEYSRFVEDNFHPEVLEILQSPESSQEFAAKKQELRDMVWKSFAEYKAEELALLEENEQVVAGELESMCNELDSLRAEAKQRLRYTRKMAQRMFLMEETAHRCQAKLGEILEDPLSYEH